jgi:hypothetical protein
MQYPPAYHKALARLRAPGSRLVVTYTYKRSSGRIFAIVPGGGFISETVARELLQRRDLRPDAEGLFPGQPQSWGLMDRRSP